MLHIKTLLRILYILHNINVDNLELETGFKFGAKQRLVIQAYGKCCNAVSFLDDRARWQLRLSAFILHFEYFVSAEPLFDIKVAHTNF